MVCVTKVYPTLSAEKNNHTGPFCKMPDDVEVSSAYDNMVSSDLTGHEGYPALALEITTHPSTILSLCLITSKTHYFLQ